MSLSILHSQMQLRSSCLYVHRLRCYFNFDLNGRLPLDLDPEVNLCNCSTGRVTWSAWCVGQSQTGQVVPFSLQNGLRCYCNSVERSMLLLKWTHFDTEAGSFYRSLKRILVCRGVLHIAPEIDFCLTLYHKNFISFRECWKMAPWPMPHCSHSQ